jgi:hypothetical protein
VVDVTLELLIVYLFILEKLRALSNLLYARWAKRIVGFPDGRS